MINFLKQKNKKEICYTKYLCNKGFTHLVDFGDALTLRLKRTKSASPKFTTGFTLVETLVAISIFSVSILGLMTFLSDGISTTGYAKKKIISVYLAQEGIESVRNMRDSFIFSESPSRTWTTFRARLGACNNNIEPVNSNKCGFNNSLEVFDADYIFNCSSNPNDCKLYLNNGNYNTESLGVDSGFTRTIGIYTINQDEIKVFSTVSWTQNSIPYNITLTENLFNWTE